jgi:hypothetical protein
MAAAATQPPSRSGRAADAATQPLSGWVAVRVAEWLSGWPSRSYQSGWVAECLPSHSGRAAEFYL